MQINVILTFIYMYNKDVYRYLVQFTMLVP